MINPNASDQRVRIKFCGMTSVTDALAAVRLGVDAVGVVLSDKSKRFAGIARAQEIRAALPPLVTLVALFMDDEPGFIAQAVARVQPDLLQFHGSETAQDCVRYGAPYLKAIAMAGFSRSSDGELIERMQAHPKASGFLLDGHASGEQGGSGKTFDWSMAQRAFDRPVLLAGGLTAHNVGAAIRATRPYAVDVSSGIESAPGIKDLHLMQRFVAAVQETVEVKHVGQ
jgi:phosphoribosylanthranilate isomerase